DDRCRARERDRAALEDVHRDRVALARCDRERARCRDDRRRGMWLAVEVGQHVAELADAELLEKEWRQPRRSAAAVDRVRDRADCLEAAPHRRYLLARDVA